MVLLRNFLEDVSVGSRTVHLDEEIWWQERLDYYTHKPNGVFFTQPLAHSKEWEVDSLNVADSRISPNIRSKNPPHRVLNLFSDKGVVWKSPTHILVDLTELDVGTLA